MERWIVDDVQDAGQWLLYDENATDPEQCVRVRGSKELAQRVADGLNAGQAAAAPSAPVAEVFQGYKGLILEASPGATLKPGDKLYLHAQAATETPAPDGFVFPPMPPAVVMHEKVGPLFDRLSMQFYAAKCMRRAADADTRRLLAELVKGLRSESGDTAYSMGYNGALDDVLARSRGEMTASEIVAAAAPPHSSK